MYIFFSSRRRHTSSKRDWSSDVCSSDLAPHLVGCDFVKTAAAAEGQGKRVAGNVGERRSEERRVGKSVDLGGRWIIKKIMLTVRIGVEIELDMKNWIEYSAYRLR